MPKKKLILFDIDGTLLLTGGVAAGLMVESLSKILHRPIQWGIRDFVGHTDHSILFSLLRRNGATEPLVDDMAQKAMELYLQGLEKELKKDGVMEILPGVKKLLKKLDKDEQFALGLLTGNVEQGARIKLTQSKLNDYFPFGAFGDDALNRDQLPAFAIQRAEKYYRQFFERSDTWIVGDSVNDIRCAHSNHLKSMVVTTGHYKEAELLKYRPTVLLTDLSDTEKVIQKLVDG